MDGVPVVYLNKVCLFYLGCTSVSIVWRSRFLYNPPRWIRGKFSTSIFQMASIPVRIFKRFSTFLMLSWARITAGHECSQIKSSVLVTSVGYLLTTVTFGDHDHAATLRLEQVYIRVHTAGSCGTEGARCHTGRCFSRTSIVDGVIFDILRAIPDRHRLLS